MTRIYRVEYRRRESKLHEESASKISKGFFISLQLTTEPHVHVRGKTTERHNNPQSTDRQEDFVFPPVRVKTPQYARGKE